VVVTRPRPGSADIAFWRSRDFRIGAVVTRRP
jgi:hypothetical protein